MLNQVVLVGRISTINKEIMNRDEGNKRFTTIVIATPRSFKNEEGEYDTDFIRIKLIGVVAENTLEYCNQGDLIGIKGRIQTTGQNNVIEIIAEKVTFLTSKKRD